MSDELQEIIEKLPALPEVALRVVQIVGTPDYEMSDLVGVIRTDPSLTTRILKLCNSSLFALRAPITTVEGALPFLGARNLTKVVVTSCTRDFFVHAEGGYHCKPGELWRHSVACAIASQLIASEIGSEEVGTAFTAGVLHNVGKVALAVLLHRNAEAMDAASWEAGGLDFLDCERQVTGLDHAQAGSLVTERWPLPSELRRAIVNHHDPEAIADDPPLTATVHLADLLCLQLGIGAGIDGLRYRTATTALSRTGLSGRDLDNLRGRLLVELRRNQELVNLGTPDSR